MSFKSAAANLPPAGQAGGGWHLLTAHCSRGALSAAVVELDRWALKSARVVMHKSFKLFIVLPIALAGCTTIGTLGESETRNKIYSGTVRQVEQECAHGTCLDFPFSLVADTVLLPITIPWTVVNLANKKPEQNKPEKSKPSTAAPKK